MLRLLADFLFQKDVTKGKITKEEMDETKKRISTATDMSFFKDADFVIEVCVSYFILVS